MTPSPISRLRPNLARLTVLFTLAALLTLGALPATVAGAQPSPPPGDELEQRIDDDQSITTGRKVLSDGHVDIGPRFVEDDWTLMVHDDTADPSVWRQLDRTVFQVTDEALLEVPDDPAYEFIGKPGTPVYVVPQVQEPGVAWVGWNTQDPEVMDTIDGGVTLTLTRVDGPGKLYVYLQAGNFGSADVLWDSSKRQAQDLWVEVNTHTHANWVFTEPGSYLVQVEASAELVDGRSVSDTRALRFAVGDQTDAAEAFAATAPPAATKAQQATPDPAPAADENSSSTTTLIAIGGAGVVLLAAFLVVVVRGRAAKRRALADRHGRSGETAAP